MTNPEVRGSLVDGQFVPAVSTDMSYELVTPEGVLSLPLANVERISAAQLHKAVEVGVSSALADSREP